MVAYFMFWSDIYDDRGQFKSINRIVTQKNKISNFQRYFSVHIFQKKYFCGRPHEIYFRHPVQRKQSIIFFWPKCAWVFCQRNPVYPELQPQPITFWDLGGNRGIGGIELKRFHTFQNRQRFEVKLIKPTSDTNTIPFIGNDKTRTSK